MTLSEIVGISDTRERHLARVLQAALVGIVILGLYRRNIGLVVNGGVAIAITFVPALLQRKYSLPMDGGLVLWITAAVFLHALGVLWLYGVISWYDQLAHVLSGSVVAAAGYTSVRALDRHSEVIEIPADYMIVFVFVFILAFGVLWEILEFVSGLVAQLLNANAILAQHGIDDTALDLLADTTGAVIVAALNTPQLKAVAGSIAGRIGT